MSTPQITIAVIIGGIVISSGLTMILLSWINRNKRTNQFFTKHLQIDKTRFFLLSAGTSLFGRSVTVEIQNGEQTWPAVIVIIKTLKSLEEHVQNGGTLSIIGINKGIGICLTDDLGTHAYPERGIKI